MPVIYVKGMDVVLDGIRSGLDELRDGLPKRYEKELSLIADNIRRDSVTALGKPSWLLSSYLEKKVRIYKDGKYLFGVIQAQGPRNPAQNTPAFYAWYQEHGYHIALDKVKRVNKNRLVYGRNKNKKNAYATGYRRQSGRHFLKTAFEDHKYDLKDAVEKVNGQIEKEMNKRLKK